MHLACQKGNYELLKFVHSKVSPGWLNIMEYIINEVDDLGRTPLFLLCVRGFDKHFDLDN
jgi:hypothetical protein